MEKEKKEKKSNWLLVTLLIVALLAAFAFGGLAVGLIKSPKGDTYITNTSANKDEKEKSESKETTSTTGFAALDFDKCINKKGNAYKPQPGDMYQLGIYIIVNNDLKSVNIQYNSLKLNETYALGWETTRGEFESLGTKTLSKKISQVFVGGYGQAAGNDTIFYLMEDGTVQYTPIYKELTNDTWKQSDDNKKFNSYGEIPNVEQVVSLSLAAVTFKDSPTGGHVTTIARRADGSFYDLGELLREAGIFNY